MRILRRSRLADAGGSIAFGGLVSLVFRGLNLLVSLALVVATSNVLGPSGRGTFAIGVTAVGIATALGAGLTASVAYQVANRQRQPGEALAGGSLVGGAVAAAGLVVGAVLWPLLPGEGSALAMPIALGAAATILIAAIDGVYLGAGQIVRYNVGLVLPPLLALLAVGGYLVAGGRDATVTFLCFVGGQWAGIPVLLALGAGREVTRLRIEGPFLRAIMRFAVLAGFSSGVSYLNYRADTFVVDYFEGKDGVALYSNAVYIAESIWQVSGSLAIAAYSRIGSLDREAAAELTARLMRHTFFLLFAICGAVFALADVVVGILFSSEFEAVAPALRFLLPGTVLYGLAGPFSAFYTYQRGQPSTAGVLAGSGLIIDITMDIVLIPHMGVNGAALASAIAYATCMVGGLAFFMHGERLSPWQVFRPRREDVEDYRTLFGRLRSALVR